MIVATSKLNRMITSAVCALSREGSDDAYRLLQRWRACTHTIRLGEFVIDRIDEYPDLRELATARVIANKLEGK